VRAVGLLAVGFLLCGCVTKALWAPNRTHAHPRLAGEAECAVERIVEPRAPRPSIAFAITPPEDRPPKRMRRAFDAGWTWLFLRDPFAFSFAGRDLLQGCTPLRPGRVTVGFAQTRLSDGGVRRAPALLRIEGTVADGDLAACVERVPDRGAPGEELDALDDRDLRVRLGHGVDTLLELAEGPAPLETFAWIGVEGPEGLTDDWRGPLEEALRQQSREPLRPYRVIVRRRRAGGDLSCFRVPLAVVVVAAQISFAEEAGSRRWTWEGLWIGELAAPDEEATPTAWQDVAQAHLHYQEYKQDPKYGAKGVIWRTLLTPLALTADYGIGAIDDWLHEEDELEPLPHQKVTKKH